MNTITDLYTYPVKSCAGIRHTRIDVSQAGLYRDRQWVIVDAHNRFMSQRNHPKMALLQPVFQGDDLSLTAPGMPAITVPWLIDTDDPPAIPVSIWGSDSLGFDEGPTVAEWLSTFLGQPCRLLRAHPLAERVASLDHVRAWRDRHDPAFPERHQFGFADGFPFLLIGQASLDELNARMAHKGGTAVQMSRFRPNIVIGGLDAHEEDHLAGIHVGPLRFAFVKRCGRCSVPNVDPDTGVPGEEPNDTLSEYRQFQDGILFGVNAVVAGAGPGAQLTVGQEVELQYAF